MEGGLQTSAVGRPVERVTAVAQTLEAAGGVDADVVAGPREGALVDVCVATGRVRGGVSGWAEGHACPWAPLSAQPTGFCPCPASCLHCLCARVRSHLSSSLEAGEVGILWMEGLWISATLIPTVNGDSDWLFTF